MIRRLLHMLFASREQRIARAVVRDVQARLVRMGVEARLAEVWTLEFVSYLQTPVPSCQALWRWVCRAYGTPDWPLRMHWVAAEAKSGARTSEPAGQAAASSELP